MGDETQIAVVEWLVAFPPVYLVYIPDKKVLHSWGFHAIFKNWNQNKSIFFIIIDSWVFVRWSRMWSVAKNDKITVSSLNNAFTHQIHDTHSVSSLDYSWRRSLCKSACLVCWLMCLLTARPRISHKCSMHDKSRDIGGQSSRWTPFRCKKLSAILARWGLALSSWNMAFWPIWRRYGTTCGRRISSMQIYRRPFKFPGTMPKAVLLIPAHIMTLPPLYAVVGWTEGSKCLSPLRRHTRIRPSIFCRQNLDSSKNRTCYHCCRFHLSCRAHSWRLRALWRWESWGFLAGFLELNPYARTLFLIVCTEMPPAPGPRCRLNILYRLGPSTKRRLATVTAMYRSSPWVVTFGRPDLGWLETVSVARWRSRSRIIVLRRTNNRAKSWGEVRLIIPCSVIRHFWVFYCRPLIPLDTGFSDISRGILTPFQATCSSEMGLNLREGGKRWYKTFYQVLPVFEINCHKPGSKLFARL